MKILFVLLAIMAFQLRPEAQVKVKAEDLDVKDSSGTAYPTILWQKLVMSGKYGIKIQTDGKTALLGRLTEEEIAARFSRMPKPKESQFFTTGGKIASFSEKDMNGIKYNLKELAGKVVVLNFWFINCPPCRQEIPALNEVVETFKDNKDVVFIAVALDPKYDIIEFLKTNPFQYNIIDNARYIASKYNVNSYPTHVVLDKQGKVLFHTSGFGMSTVGWVKKSIEAGLNDTVLQ